MDQENSKNISQGTNFPNDGAQSSKNSILNNSEQIKVESNTASVIDQDFRKDFAQTWNNIRPYDPETEPKLPPKPQINLNPLSDFRGQISKAPYWFKLTLITLSIVIILSLIIIYSINVIFNQQQQQQTLDENYEIIVANTKSENIDRNLFLPDNIQSKSKASIITGVLYTDEEYKKFSEKKPIAAVIENSRDARPVAGLTNADVVYLGLVEGGITRYLAIFWSENPQEYGPIRSLRAYAVNLASEYNSIIHHYGIALADATPPKDSSQKISYQNVDARQKISANGIFDFECGTEIDQDRLNFGIGAEHVRFSSTEKALYCANEINPGVANGTPTIASYKFKSDAKLEDRAIAQEISYSFGSENEKWNYDRTSNTYKYYVGVSELKEKYNDQTISTKNLILQFTPFYTFKDSASRVYYDLIGSGDARIYIDGKEIKATWKKENNIARTRYFDEAGSEIIFNRGNFWVILAPIGQNNNVRFSYSVK
jgi:hypothetical protein